MNDKGLDKELAKKMNNPYYFTDRDLQIGYNINLDSHNINHANSILTITPNSQEIVVEFRYINKILKELSVIYARIMNRYTLKKHTLFSASFYEIKEENQRKYETELFIHLNINSKSTEKDIDKIDVKSHLERQTQFQETKESVWIFEEFISRKISFFKLEN